LSTFFGNEKYTQVIGFRIHNQEFGINIFQVQEVYKMQDITQVPNSPEIVAGVINLRGRVIPIVDIRKNFGISALPESSAKIIITEIQGRTIGIIVDQVSEVLKIPVDQIEPAPDIALSIKSSYIIGVAKLKHRLLILLDMNSMFSDQEIDQFKGKKVPE
jgi:purine-binding chemotaxis protein CheW